MYTKLVEFVKVPYIVNHKHKSLLWNLCIANLYVDSTFPRLDRTG